ncbi:BlaI/MecI/CopY family transcriptional regulator [Ornithinimicrobium faecis]|uniref:BlaI/MecI/CopY family transcriptional regulator n=1 Tax=Ornithinimicrobium faecis TaxID=2934158 RepID=A0ABY4Z057_9MICO|nr:BlaI/MecI/CopY family transcriptional regulator [Ornithinimicrobium sp. HY1793]USQ81993.1 BlaI/MecI/CopY family transcriptional regulator [Ornithinimicrobium sp. HY1793]
MSERTSGTGLPRLGALETQVMDVLWDHGPVTVREVIDRLGGTSAYTTIATVLGNLDRKGLVTITRRGRSTRYAARLSRQAHAAELMGHVLDASQDRAASILHFVDTMPESDLALLRDYLGARGAGEPS